LLMHRVEEICCPTLSSWIGNYLDLCFLFL
jgi:hypothetical protein